MKRIKVLVFCLMFLVSCAGLSHLTLNKDYKARDVVMFSDYSKEEVYGACIDCLVDRYHCTIILSDMDAGLIQARQVMPGLVAAVVFKWTVQVLKSGEGVDLNVHLDRSVEYMWGGASGNVRSFIRTVKEHLWRMKKK